MIHRSSSRDSTSSRGSTATAINQATPSIADSTGSDIEAGVDSDHNSSLSVAEIEDDMSAVSGQHTDVDDSELPSPETMRSSDVGSPPDLSTIGEESSSMIEREANRVDDHNGHASKDQLRPKADSTSNSRNRSGRADSQGRRPNHSSSRKDGATSRSGRESGSQSQSRSRTHTAAPTRRVQTSTKPKDTHKPARVSRNGAGGGSKEHLTANVDGPTSRPLSPLAASQPPEVPLEPFDWDTLESRFQMILDLKGQEESSLRAEFERLVKVTISGGVMTLWTRVLTPGIVVL